MKIYLVFTAVFFVQVVFANEKYCINPGFQNSNHSSCNASQSKHLYKSIEQTNAESYSPFSILESGLEFLTDDDDYVQNIDAELFFEGPDGEFKTDMSDLELVQAFIRNLKGLSPLPSPGLNLDAPVLPPPRPSGSEGNKPDWVFHPYRLKTLVDNEVKIYGILKNYSENPEHPKPFPALRSYLLDMERSTMKALAIRNSSDIPKNPGTLLETDPYLYIASHPLLIYRMIRRFAEELPPIFKIIMTSSNKGARLIEEMFIMFPDFKIFPGPQDLEDVWKSLWRIQNGVNLKTTEFARGKLEHIETMLGVNALQALEVGVYHFEENHYDYAIEWFHLAFESVKVDRMAQKYPIIQNFFEDCLNSAIKLHNERWVYELQDKWKPAVFNTTVTIPFDPSAYARLFDLMDDEVYRDRHIEKWNPATRGNFIRTCAGRNFQSEEEKAALTCWYERSKHPYWYFNPQKIELINKNPDLFQIYDFIGDKMIEKMKDDAIEKLERSMVVDTKDHTRSKVDSTRTSIQTWLYDKEGYGDYLIPLTRRLELLTGWVILPEESSDAYQVALYGPSQHYEAHIDSFDDPRRCVSKGNRIATIMGYLSDTEVGGRTGFPVMGVAASPRKGSIVIWENLQNDRVSRDLRTWHGGCSCTLGLKWITNKWVYSHENMFAYQCPAKS